MGCPAPAGAAPHPACAASRLDPLATAVHKLSNARNDSVGDEAHSIQHGSVPDGGENQPGCPSAPVAANAAGQGSQQAARSKCGKTTIPRGQGCAAANGGEGGGSAN